MSYREGVSPFGDNISMRDSGMGGGTCGLLRESIFQQGSDVDLWLGICDVAVRVQQAVEQLGY